jgi:hypothetical protein
MSDEPVLTSSWCTNWAGFNTPRLWAMVSNEDDPDAWRQVSAWADVAVAVKDQRSRLVQARDSLTAAWPPEQNGSSQAFVTQLDKLIGVMDAAQHDADATASGLANILDALRSAKDLMQPLYEEFKDKSDDWVPNWWDHAEDEIDTRARTVMIAAEQIVEQNVPQLKVPDPYTMDPKGSRLDFAPDDHSDPSVSSRASGPGAAPAIPVPHDPVPPLPGHDGTVPSDAGPSPSDAAPSLFDASFVGQTGGVSGGPGLAGVIAPPPAAAPSAGTIPPGALPPVGVPVGGGPVAAIPPVPPILPGILPGGPAGGAAVPGVGGIGGGVARGARPVGGVAGRALPSGAVIGETVGGVRGGVAGTPEIGGVAGRGAVAEVGGVSGRGAGRAGVRGAKPKVPPWLPEDERRGSAGGRGGGATGPAGMASGRRAARRDAAVGEQFDPDNPWETAEGVDPVIGPPEEIGRHDPGPNVIGWRG